ncbi:unnamed protein product, partial [Iphiclides podalirius]
MKVFTDPLWTWERAALNFLTMTFDVELTYVTIILFYLRCKFDKWIGALGSTRSMIAKVRRFAKNIICLNRMHSEKLSACGVFTVDGELPLRLVALIADYTVVLLQFAFL